MASQEPNDIQINIQDDSSPATQLVANQSSSNDTSQHATNPVASVPFVPSQLYHFARRTLDIADYYGEKLAYFFGITSPKYEAEIREYERKMNRRKAEKEHEANEYSGWNIQPGNQPLSNTQDSPNHHSVTFAPGPDPPQKY